MPSARRPNVLLVFADQWRYSAASFNGNPDVRTPALDQFARQGMRLTHCFANTPVCGPSRATMLTGTHFMTHGVVSNDLPVRTDLPAMGTIFSAAGYRTGYIGKWHLDGVPRSKFTPPGVRRLGFEHWAAYNCAHSYFNTRYFTDDDELVRTSEYEPVTQTSLAIDFLREAAQDGVPFALALSWGPPHDPYPEVPPEYRDRYDPAAITLPPNVRPDVDNPLARRLECRRTIADYYAACTALDDQFARLLQSLEQLNLAQNTVVIFTSDHGDMLWSHGYMKKQLPFDEAARVPFLARGPGIKAGVASDALTTLADLLPTMLGHVGLECPSSIEGKDQSSVLREPQMATGADAILLANPHSCDEAKMQHLPEWRAVRTHQHLYVERQRGVPWLLFDCAADPHQMHNLVDTPSNTALQQELAARLKRLLSDTNDPFLPGEQLFEQLNLVEAWRDRNERINL